MSTEGAREQLTSSGAMKKSKSGRFATRHFVARSWPGAPGVGLDRIAVAKRQIGKSVEDLRAGKHVGGASLCECSLSRSHIQQVTKPVVVRFKGSIVGLAGGFQEGGGGLALPKSSVQIGVGAPDLVRNLVASNA